MNKAVFVDRDGTIANDPGYCSSSDKFNLFAGVPKGLEILKDLGFKLILVTNQSGIERGYFGELELWQIHARLLEVLRIFNVTFSGIYYCPHNPETTKCLCRKPGTLLLDFAIKQHNINVFDSWMIGDTYQDVNAAISIGLKPILIADSQHEHTVTTAKSFFDACKYIECVEEGNNNV